MFFGEGRIPIVQQMILADNEADRRKALDKLLPLQRDDFYGVFKGMHGCPVTIRTIDPPLHEFLPKREDLMVEVAKLEAAGKRGRELDEKRTLLARVEQLHEFNPMLGHRGVRLGITYPEITEMQTRAIIEAACKLSKEGVKVVPEIMIPLVGMVKELRDQKIIVDRVAAEVMKAEGVKIKYLVGTMIEVPRGAVTADEVAAEAQFFSFGTNDLTQLTFGFSRDDVGKFLRIYQDKKILEKRSVRVDRRRRRRQTGRDGRRARAQGPQGSEARHLRRARRRSRIDSLLRKGRPRLREHVAVPCAGGAPRGRAGRARGESRRLSKRADGEDHSSACRSRQSDCRGRGRRAASFRRQGAGRERDRRGRDAVSSFTTELGGKKQVRVEDDGEGMEPEDARLSIERHATSKIRRADDLAAILTLGFRGEALPSIASVSHFVLRTRSRGRQSGTEIRVNGGAIASTLEVAAAEGTAVEVNDLFYNLPARRKFLKSDAGESAQVSRIVTQLALAYPEIGFTLTSAGRTVIQCPPALSLTRPAVSAVRRARRPHRSS